MKSIWYIPVIACVAITTALPLAAGERHGARVHGGDEGRMPPKDCTRFNGRWGYYGNPWCTPTEQRAFDRWEADRVNRLRAR